ncbi:ABC transporter permease [Alloacidobacterium dinghuense]|uniref:ABC transporter permease n=1 Tax=Alloacidobacterium dinghuense TaxID=2763107 RepID=A0A7G8BRF7_9BACT|nr:ABC transporter permease [Alloacidobacterium dinghuense]
MHTLLQDIRYSFRQLRNHPGFALTAVLSLALGIGATVSVFSVIYGVIMHPYSYADLNRLVTLSYSDPYGNFWNAWITGPQLRELQQAHAVESIAAWNEWNLTVTGHDVPEDVAAYTNTSDTFPTLGVSPLLGRNLGPSDSPEGQEPQPVVMLNYRFWQRHFSSDSTVIGKTLELVHKKYTIVGVTRPHFTWGWDADVYLPQKLTNDQALQFGVVIKLRPGITQAAANAELQPLMERFAKETPTHFPPKFKVDVRELSYWTVHQLGGTLYLLFAAVAMLLAIGCGNVSILLMARGTARQHEFAVRSAVGASGSRIVRQLLTESLMLSLTGAGLGILLAYRILALIVAWLPRNFFPSDTDFSVNPPVLLFCVGLAMLTGVLFGLFPALQMARPEIGQVMQSSTKKAAGSVRGKRVHSTLIAGQIALTLLLMTAAGAAVNGFLSMMRVNLGYDPHNVISIGIPIHENTYTNWTARMNYYEQLRAKIAELPDIVSTGISTNATPPSSGDEQRFELLGKAPNPSIEGQTARLNYIDPGYFRTLNIPLLQGRMWTHTETAHSALLAIVNETFAKRFYPAGDMLGHSVEVPTQKNEPPYTLTVPGADSWMQIIGVVRDSLNDGLDKPVKPAIYMPYGTVMWMHTQILIRSRTDPQSILHSIRQQVTRVDPDQQVNGEVDSLETWIRNEPEWARGRLISVLFAAFSILALVLAAVGLYSVVSYSVAQRTNEFGIRMALGASKTDVLKIVLASAGASIGLGIALGFAVSFGLNRLIARWVESSNHNPLLILGAAAVLLAVAILACVAPARRASSVDPMTALRCE